MAEECSKAEEEMPGESILGVPTDHTFLALLVHAHEKVSIGNCSCKGQITVPCTGA